MRILIVCTGNILRSVMAEHLLRSELPNGVSIDSAGYPCKRTGINPRPATREAMKEIDLDVSAHRSKRVTSEMIDQSDLILVMTQRKKEALIAAYPNALSKAHRIREFDPDAPRDDIADIFLLTPDKARELRDDLRACIPGIKNYVSRFCGKGAL